MSAVVEAITDVVDTVVDAVDKYVVEPIKKDPLSFVATVAAATFAGPGAFGIQGLGLNAIGVGAAAGAANAAAGLAQGESFNEAIKGGALAGITTWAGAELQSKFGSSGSPGSPNAPIDKGVINNTFKNIDDAAFQTTDDIFAQAAKSSAKNISPPTGEFVSTAPVAVDAAPNLNTGIDKNILDPFTEKGPLSYSGSQPADVASGTSASNAASNAVKADVTGGGVYTSSADGAASGGSGIYKDILTNKALDFPSASGASALTSGGSGTLTPGGGGGMPGLGFKVDGIDLATQYPTVVGGDIGTPSVLDKAITYGRNAWDWAAANPAYSIPIALTAASYLGQKDEPPSGGDSGAKIGDPNFYEPMKLYDLSRQQLAYGDDIYKYGTTGGEAEFFTPAVYEPVKYALGGSVMPQQNDYGYYTYGNIPRTMRRFAKGGLGSLQKQGALSGSFDGRSDDIPAVLSDGEFVVDAETVALLGNGSSKAGADRLEEMRQAIRKQKGGALSRGQFSPDAKSPLAYLKSSKRSRG